MGVLGQVERGEAALLGRPGQVGRGHVPIGQEAGDAEPHGSQSPSPAASWAPGLTSGSANRCGEGRLLAPSGVGDGRAPGLEHQVLDLAGGVGRERGDGPGQFEGLGQHGAVGARPQGQAGRHGLVGGDPLRGEQRGRRLLPAHPGRQQVAAGRLGWDAHLGEGRPQAGRLVHQHQVDVAEDRAAEAHAHPVHRGQQGLVEAQQQVEQVLEPRAGVRTGVAGGDGHHLAEVLAGGERLAPPGQHHGVDVVVPQRAGQGPGHRPVHRRGRRRCGPRGGRRR